MDAEALGDRDLWGATGSLWRAGEGLHHLYRGVACLPPLPPRLLPPTPGPFPSAPSRPPQSPDAPNPAPVPPASRKANRPPAAFWRLRGSSAGRPLAGWVGGWGVHAHPRRPSPLYSPVSTPPAPGSGKDRGPGSRAPGGVRRASPLRCGRHGGAGHGAGDLAPCAGPCPVRSVSRPPSGETWGVGSPSCSNPLKVLGPQGELSF